MKKKILAILLMAAMSASLLVGCGGDSKEAGSDKETNVTDENDVKQEEEDSEKIKTITYDVTYGDSIMKCEITYNADKFNREFEIFDNVEPVTNLSEGQAEMYYHVDSEMGYWIYVPTLNSPTAHGLYEGEKENLKMAGIYENASFSDLSTEMIGDIETQAYTYKLTYADEIVVHYYWMIEFPDGIMVVTTSNYEEELPLSIEEEVENLLIDVTLNGKEPKTSSDTDYVATENDNTLTASDLLIPTIEIDGVVYTFPMEAKELVDNGWVMDELPVERPANPGEMVAMEFYKEDMTLFTNISTTTGEAQSIEEGEVCSIDYFAESDNINVPITFPGNLTLGMSKAEVEQMLPGEFEYVAEYHYFKYRYDTEKGEIAIEIHMTEDDSVVERISYTCWTD